MTHSVDSPPPDSAGSARRVFLKQLAAASGSLPLGKVLAGGTATALLLQSAEATAAPSAKPVINTVYGYASFGPDEAAFVEAMLNIMCPADAHTPNGVDCGLAIYIDRQLAGSFGQGARRRPVIQRRRHRRLVRRLLPLPSPDLTSVHDNRQ